MSYYRNQYNQQKRKVENKNFARLHRVRTQLKRKSNETR